MRKIIELFYKLNVIDVFCMVWYAMVIIIDYYHLIYLVLIKKPLLYIIYGEFKVK